MRRVFIKTLVELAEVDPRILLLTGDLGYTVIEPFAEKFPERFFNVGVAEQNMVGLATGLAEAGYLPFLYSIATFAVLRPYEFIRNGPILHQYPIRIIGVGGGFEYGSAGPTHHALEDVGVLRLQPGITVIAPGDFEQAKTALLQTWDSDSPIYYRLGKDDQTVVPGLEGKFHLGETQVIRSGRDLAFVVSGAMATEVVAAAEVLAEQGIQAAVIFVAGLNPPPVQSLCERLENLPLALTVEAHYITGGLGSLVAEIIAEQGLSCRLVRLGVKTLPGGQGGNQQYLQHLHQFSKDHLVEAALQSLEQLSMNPRQFSLSSPTCT